MCEQRKHTQKGGGLYILLHWPFPAFEKGALHFILHWAGPLMWGVLMMVS